MQRELEELSEEYASGKLDKIKGDLEMFIKSHKAPIKQFTAQHSLNLDIGLRWYIFRKKTINSKQENLDQIDEIQKELWYRHEEDPSKPDFAIWQDWMQKHAAGWRDHRVLQIIYVYLQDKERYLALLG